MSMIVGIDEVGRGPWAGPLVVGAVILGEHTIEGLTDSKKLTKKRREALNELIYEQAAAIGLGWVQAAELDELGITKSLELACRRALEGVKVPYQQIIIDGTFNFLKDTGKGPYVTTMKKADLLIPSVSAASIVAKVARDRWMEEQASEYPEYGFESHVGYGTARHLAALKEYGVTRLHRRSFAPVASIIDRSPDHQYASARRTNFLTHSLRSAKLARAQTFSNGQERAKKFVGLTDSTHAQGAPSTRAVGDEAESLVADELEKQSYRIIARNWKTKFCEIDIVAEKEDTIFFCEVKHRKNTSRGGGIAAITPKKLHQMKFAAELFRINYAPGSSAQLMVATTTGSPPTLEEILALE